MSVLFQVWTNFNPRSPCGERPTTAEELYNAMQFQSTLPVRGATPSGAGNTNACGFQSTLPVRGATAFYRPVELA